MRFLCVFLLLIKLGASAALPAKNGNSPISSSEEPTSSEEGSKPTKLRPRPVFTDGFEIDISYPEEFKPKLPKLIIPTPLPHLHIERDPPKFSNVWARPNYPPPPKKHEKRSFEKRGVGEFLWKNKFAIVTGALLYAGGTVLWNWWKTRRAESAAEKAALDAMKTIEESEALEMAKKAGRD